MDMDYKMYLYRCLDNEFFIMLLCLCIFVCLSECASINTGLEVGFGHYCQFMDACQGIQCGLTFRYLLKRVFAGLTIQYTDCPGTNLVLSSPGHSLTVRLNETGKRFSRKIHITIDHSVV